MSTTACANPCSLRPMPLIGKPQGKLSAEPVSSDSGRLALARAHDLLLELLVEPVHALEDRARAALADRGAVQPDDGENFLRGRAHPELVGAAHFGLRDRAQLQ